MTKPRHANSLTSVEALATLTEACRSVHLPDQGADLLRLGENAIFRLAQAPIVVRIARNLDVLKDAEKEVAVSEWLRNTQLAATELADYDQPMVARDKPVTFWKLIDDTGAKATLVDLGTVLRQLHSLPVPANLRLPDFDMFGRVAERITAVDLSESDRSFLADRLDSLRASYRELRFELPPSAVHGDAHQSNLIVKPDGTVVMIDLERFAFGHPETDLSVTATEYLIGWHTDEEYTDFVDAYGYDVREMEGFQIIRMINELKMTTWLMQNIGESEQTAEEFRTRLASLRDDDAPRNWQPY